MLVSKVTTATCYNYTKFKREPQKASNQSGQDYVIVVEHSIRKKLMNFTQVTGNWNANMEQKCAMTPLSQSGGMECSSAWKLIFGQN